MNCNHCKARLPDDSRRERRYCNARCRARAHRLANADLIRQLVAFSRDHGFLFSADEEKIVRRIVRKA